MEIFDNEITGYAFEPMNKDELSISDDSIHWFPLFPRSSVTDTSWLKKYGVVSLPFAPSTIYLKSSSYERILYNDTQKYIIDLEKVDCDISFDGFKWFHIFNAICKNNHQSYYNVQQKKVQ